MQSMNSGGRNLRPGRKMSVQQLISIRNLWRRNSLVVLWLGLCTFTAEGAGSTPGRGT